MFKFISQKKLFLTVFTLFSLVSVYSAQGMDDLYTGITQGDIESITKLLEDETIKQNINKLDNTAKIPFLSLAIFVNNIEMMKLLLQNGADPNMTDRNNRPPLWFALRKPNAFEMVKLLIKNGADLRRADHETLCKTIELLFKNDCCADVRSKELD